MPTPPASPPASPPEPVPTQPHPWAIGSHWNEFCASVADDIRGFSWEGPRTRRAIATGLACALSVIVAVALNLDYPLWSGMTAFTVTQASVKATTLKGLLRIAGTIAGALIGILLVGFIAASHAGLLVALFASISYGLYRSYLSRYFYAWLLGAITVGLVLLTTMAEPDAGLHAAGYRAAEIVTGVAVAWLVGELVLPESLDPEKDKALIAEPALHSRMVAAVAAIEAGMGIVIVTLLYDAFDLPGFSSAAVSMTRIADPDPRLGRRRGFLRLVGCTIGAVTGLACVWLSIDTLPGLLIALFAACAVFGYFASGSAASAYGGMQAGFAFLIAFVEGNGPALSLTPAIDRLAGIFLAVLVFWLLDALIGLLDREAW